MGSNELLAQIEDDRETLVAFLQGFLQAATPNPPGDTRAAHAHVAALLEAEGIAYETVVSQEDLPNIVATVEGKGPGPHLLLNGHMDVFPVPEGEDWTHGPWSGVLAEERIWGRGSVDMKSGTTASIFTFLYLAQRRDQWRGKLTLTVVSDEETMGPHGTNHILKTRPELCGDCCLNGEPSALGTLRYGEKGFLWLQIDVATGGGHGAYPHLSRSANKIAAQVIADLETLDGLEVAPPPEYAERLGRSYAAAERVLGAGAGRVASSVVVNIGTLQGGIKVNVIPSHCRLEVDIRVPIGLTIDEVWDKVLAITGEYPEAAVTEIVRSEPNFYPGDHPLLEIIQRNAGQIAGLTPEPIIGLGATDARLWRHRGLPAFVYGPSPAGMGARNEAVLVEEFMTVVKVHALSALEYLSQEMRSGANRSN